MLFVLAVWVDRLVLIAGPAFAVDRKPNILIINFDKV